jgi:FkbM family methyltransferase
MEVEERIVQLFPARYQLAARYQYRKLRGRLETEMAWIDRLIDPGRRAIDIGANVGIYAHLLAKRCNQVEAFEPLPACAAAIRRCNNPRIAVHECGLSDSTGHSTLFIPMSEKRVEDGYASLQHTNAPHQEIDIKLCQLDDFDFSDVSFIKIDVEGHEQAVLRGGRMTILRERPVMLIEIEQRHHIELISDVFSDCLEMGYAGYFVANGELQPISEFDPAIHQSQSFIQNQRASYINNFFFKPV